jgi:uncharacterized membrane protein
MSDRGGYVRRLLALLLLTVLVGAAHARFEWRDVVQSVTIQPDGTVIVDDQRTLWTDEDFGEAFICLEHPSNVKVTLLRGSGAISPGPSSQAFQQACQDGAAGTELVVRNEVRIQERRFRFVYSMQGTADPYSDVVQWYWNLIQLDHPPIVGYQLTVDAPGSMDAPFDAYVHRYNNPEEPTVTLTESRNRLTVGFDRIPNGDGVEIRYLMDPALFTLRGTSPGFQELLEDEVRVAGIQLRDRRLESLRSSPLWALVGLALIGWLAVRIRSDYNRYGREPDLPEMKYPFEPPSDIPPAAVTSMASQTHNASAMGPAFHATIMDLARRGYGEFTGKGRKFEMQLDLSRDDTELEDFERQVLDYLKTAARQNKRGDDAHLEFKELKAYSQKNSSVFMSRWGKKPRAWIEARLGGPLVSKESTAAARRWSGRAFLIAATLAAGAWFTLGPARILFIVLAAAALVLVFIASGSLPSWRVEAAREVYGWRGFKRTLSDYTQMKDAPDDFFKLWDRYFVYAAAMGVAAQFLKNLQRAAPLRGLDERTMARQGAWMGASSASDLTSLSQSINSLSSALASASASASSGGSSSGGGGGGGGGGSSGGR